MPIKNTIRQGKVDTRHFVAHKMVSDIIRSCACMVKIRAYTVKVPMLYPMWYTWECDTMLNGTTMVCANKECARKENILLSCYSVRVQLYSVRNGVRTRFGLNLWRN